MGSSSPHEQVLQPEGILVLFFFPQLAALASAPWPAPHRFSYVLRQAIHCFCEWKGASGRLLALWYNELPSCPCWMPAIAQAGLTAKSPPHWEDSCFKSGEKVKCQLPRFGSRWSWMMGGRGWGVMNWLCLLLYIPEDFSNKKQKWNNKIKENPTYV